MNGRRGVSGDRVLGLQVEGAGLFTSTNADNRKGEGQKEFEGDHLGCRLTERNESSGAYILYICLTMLDETAFCVTIAH